MDYDLLTTAFVLFGCSCPSKFSQSAIEEQRYQDASRLTRLAGTSLVIANPLLITFSPYLLIAPYAFRGRMICLLKSLIAHPILTKLFIWQIANLMLTW